MPELTPAMSTALRHVLSVVEEIEANGLNVISVELPFADEPVIGIKAGPELDGDESYRFLASTVTGPRMETRSMTYRGILLEWTFEAEDLAHG